MSTGEGSFTAPGEFEPQEFVWLSWIEEDWLGGPSRSATLLELMKLLTPHVKVRLTYSKWKSPIEKATQERPSQTPAGAEARLLSVLSEAGVDTTRIELVYTDIPVGAIQDPGPFFLRNEKGALAIADFAYQHPDPEIALLDRQLAQHLGLPLVTSEVFSEGGNRQSNGKGTLLLGESVELDRNPGMTLDAIEREHLRVHGARKVVWLKAGPKDESYGRLEDGRWGIGTGGHVDVFARFADAETVLLAEVVEGESTVDPVLRETHARMKENLAILRAATDQDGRPFRVLRVPTPELMTAKVSFDDLNEIEKKWFDGAQPGEAIEFYLPGAYLNFIVANGVVVTSRFWRPGLPQAIARKDELAAAALREAFPGREVVQLDATSLLFDGGGLHCYSRNQPETRRPSPTRDLR